VDPRIHGFAFTPVNNPLDPTDPSGTFTWTGWPVGAYEGIQYSCGNGTNDQLFPANTAQGGQCVAIVGVNQSPVLTIIVIANGGNTYTIRYDNAGNVQ
jgi:hypothetical protein